MDEQSKRSLALTMLGYLWLLMSTAAAAGCCITFYITNWLEGKWQSVSVTFGIFRLCNYPSMIRSINGTIATSGTATNAICGRYDGFSYIPTIAWKACTVMQGASCGILLFITLIGFSFMWIKDVITLKGIKVAAILQLLAGLCLACSCTFYPLGWDSEFVQVICGQKSGLYSSGNCTIGWCYWTAIISSVIALMAAILAMSRFVTGYHEDDDSYYSDHNKTRSSSPSEI